MDPVRPPKPWDIFNAKQRRRLRAYANSLKARKEAGYQLSPEELADYLAIGKLLVQYEQEKEDLIRKAYQELGAAEARLQEVVNQLRAAEQAGDEVLVQSLRNRREQLIHEAEQARAELERLEGAVVSQPPSGASTPQGGPSAPTSGASTPTPSRPPTPTPPPPAPAPPAPPNPARPPTPPGPGAPAAVMAAAPKGTELLAIPQYPGHGIDPEMWLDLVDRAGTTYNWDDGRKSGAACLRMSEKALVWVDAQKKLNNVLETKPWNDFKKAFLERFKPKDNALKGTEAVMDLRQKSNESVAEYYDRVCLAVETKNQTGFTAENRTKDWYKTCRSNDIYTFMCAGLDPKIRQIIMGSAQPPKTEVDLRKMAIETEAALNAKRAINEISEKVQIAELNEQKDKDKEGGNEMDDKLAKLEKEIMAMKKGIKCYNCLEFGHIRRECPKKNQNQGQGGQGQGRGRGQFRGRGGFYRGGQNNYFRGNRGRGMPRGRGFGYGYSRGAGFRPSYTPMAYIGQPNYYQNQNPGYGPPRYGINQLQQNGTVNDPSQGLWEIVDNGGNNQNHLNY